MKRLFVAFLLGHVLGGCSHYQGERLKEKYDMGEIHGKNQRLKRTRYILDNSDQLTEIQKTELLTLHEQVYEESEIINNQIVNLKIMLFNQIKNPQYNQGKLFEIKNQLRDLYDQKFEVMTKSMIDVKKILGKDENALFPLDFSDTDF